MKKSNSSNYPSCVKFFSDSIFRRFTVAFKFQKKKKKIVIIIITRRYSAVKWTAKPAKVHHPVSVSLLFHYVSFILNSQALDESNSSDWDYGRLLSLTPTKYTLGAYIAWGEVQGRDDWVFHPTGTSKKETTNDRDFNLRT